MANFEPSVETRWHWLLVLCLVGLDYFSTLAYLPALAVANAGPLAPLVAIAVVVLTLVCALPVYLYLAGCATNGRGVAGLFERLIHGWRGKLIVLTVLGFTASDFVITRSVSTADAASHLLHNPHVAKLASYFTVDSDVLQPWIGADGAALVQRILQPQVSVTLLLLLLSFAFFMLLNRGFTRGFLVFAAAVVGIYVTLTTIIVASGLNFLCQRPEIWREWWYDLIVRSGDPLQPGPIAMIGALALAMLWVFPQMAIGIGGFELAMTVTPLVRGNGSTAMTTPLAQARNTRKLLITAALIMSALVLGATTVGALLIPSTAVAEGGSAQSRTLAYLGHGGMLADGSSANSLNRLFGPSFGNVYDISTISMLLLAGASVIVGLRRLLPHYLSRLGMEIEWAGRTGVSMLLLNGVILAITIIFQASLASQQWAYATSVLMLLMGAALAASLDAARPNGRHSARPLAAAAFFFMAVVFALLSILTACINASGVVIALLFVATIIISSMLSRWQRSTELRFQGFRYADEASRVRWERIRGHAPLFVVPNRPGGCTLDEKEKLTRQDYAIDPTVPILFVQAWIGDPSEFYQRPVITVEEMAGRVLLKVTQCVSIAHVLAAILLELRTGSGPPPRAIFGWSNERPIAANLSFILLGEGNIPWMVLELLRRAIPDAVRRPRVYVG
jgi:hypothetical protein